MIAVFSLKMLSNLFSFLLLLIVAAVTVGQFYGGGDPYEYGPRPYGGDFYGSGCCRGRYSRGYGGDYGRGYGGGFDRGYYGRGYGDPYGYGYGRRWA
nr:unnamed protein product [Haemonchus contortus]